MKQWITLTMVTISLVLALSCGRPEDKSAPAATAEVSGKLMDLSLDEHVAWEGDLLPVDGSKGSGGYALYQDFAFVLDRPVSLSFVKLTGSSVCGGEKGLAKTDFSLLDPSGQLVSHGTFRPGRRIYALGTREKGVHRFRLEFAAPGPCSMAMKFALVAETSRD